MTRALAVLTLLAAQGAVWAGAIPVVCSVNAPVVAPGQMATVSVLVDSAKPSALTYEWKATGGAFQRNDRSTVEWNPGVPGPGPYTLSVAVTGTDGSAGACSVVVFAGKEKRSAPRAEVFTRDIRSALLPHGKNEGENFGLYSYMVLGSKPNAANQERYKAFLKAFTDTVPVYDELSAKLPHSQLNIAYIPLMDAPSGVLEEQAILDHYDYGRARMVLERIQGSFTGDGPYIVSSDHPLGEPGAKVDHFLCQDLSSVPLPILKFWVNEFRVQTAQERWEHMPMSGVALRIRTGLEIAANAYPEVKTSIASLISLR